MATQVTEALQKRGWAARVVSARRVPQLREEIEAQRSRGQLAEELYQECLANLAYAPPESLPQAQSVIIVAVRQPQVRFAFSAKDGDLQAIVPPTYLHWEATDQAVAAAVNDILRPQGYQAVQASLPKKLLAVRSGLAAYGRNNITYVPGLGSFHRLVALYSDLPCREDEWQELQMAKRCAKCQACAKACPTGAIGSDRFLVHGERCLTFHNEKPRGVAFPSWTDPSWHKCLVGCMECQHVCPENKEVLDWIENGPAFSAVETALLLQGVLLERLPAATATKMRQSGLAEYSDLLPRNLQALLKKPQPVTRRLA